MHRPSFFLEERGKKGRKSKKSKIQSRTGKERKGVSSLWRKKRLEGEDSSFLEGERLLVPSAKKNQCAVPGKERKGPARTAKGKGRNSHRKKEVAF